ncbi:MAG: hypothetical protein RQ982_12110 [Gammaproteobacteria bacterium]|nr:hypothetical protein [Gammaproteobacteria bacterium]
MNPYERHLVIALALSAIIILVNVLAITNGMAEGFYYKITGWLAGL